MLLAIANFVAREVPYRHLLLALALSLGSCKKEQPTKVLQGERIRAACAMCIFEMEGVRACLWAVEIDGKFYLADGDLPKNHESHAPDGMCNMSRHAVVDGELVGGRFVASRFELEPAGKPPGNPRFTEKDVH
jgi:hypothetical protein